MKKKASGATRPLARYYSFTIPRNPRRLDDQAIPDIPDCYDHGWMAHILFQGFPDLMHLPAGYFLGFYPAQALVSL